MLSCLFHHRNFSHLGVLANDESSGSVLEDGNLVAVHSGGATAGAEGITGHAVRLDDAGVVVEQSETVTSTGEDLLIVSCYCNALGGHVLFYRGLLTPLLVELPTSKDWPVV